MTEQFRINPTTAESSLSMEAGEAAIDVGARLRILRAVAGLSIRTLAFKSGLNVNTLSLIENGKTSPSVSTLQQLAGALGVPVTEFFVTEQVTKTVFHQKNKPLP